MSQNVSLRKYNTDWSSVEVDNAAFGQVIPKLVFAPHQASGQPLVEQFLSSLRWQSLPVV